MSSKKQIAGKARLGSPEFLSEEKTMVFTISNFERLEKNEYQTPVVACHGYQWRIEVYPWGGTEEAKKNEMVSAYFRLINNQEPLKMKCTVRVAGQSKKVERVYTKEASSWGWGKLMTRTDAIGKLDKDGSLTIEVDLRCWLKSKPIWRPENNLQDKLRSLWDTDKGTDVIFKLGGGNIVRAHRLVLSIQCPDLFDIVHEAGGNGEIEIDNTDADLFALLVRHMYHEKFPTDFDLETNGFELLKLANRFGYSDLKMQIEADFVDSDLLNMETAADFLLFADGNSCALLKEAAMETMVTNQVGVMKSKGWKTLKESGALLAEVFEQLAIAASSPATKDSNTVSVLRKRCADRGLEVDGTKEMLLKRCRSEEADSTGEEV